jgi:hypothetical protein
MGRTLLAVLLGAVIHFLWGWASWDFIGWHQPTVDNVPNEQAFMSGLGSASAEEKVYFFPPVPGPDASEEMRKAYMTKVKDKPHGLVMVNHGGIEAMSPQQFGNGFLIELISTVMVVFVLVVTLPAQHTYLKRIFVVIVMGIFAGATRDLLFWNWMGYPLYYTAINLADCVVGWTAAGIVIAGLVKPSAPAAPAKV